MPAFRVWTKAAKLVERSLLEPFAGAAHLIDALKVVGYVPRSVSAYDIHPQSPCVEYRDTLVDFPSNYEVCVTNPPWLYKAAARRRRLAFPETQYDDSTVPSYAKIVAAPRFDLPTAAALSFCELAFQRQWVSDDASASRTVEHWVDIPREQKILYDAAVRLLEGRNQQLLLKAATHYEFLKASAPTPDGGGARSLQLASVTIADATRGLRERMASKRRALDRRVAALEATAEWSRDRTLLSRAKEELKSLEATERFVESKLAELTHAADGSAEFCPICDDASATVLLGCGHVLCESCLRKVTADTCPFCRVKVSAPLRIVPSNAVEEASPTRLQEALRNCGPKVEAMLRLANEQVQAGERIVVFSQWARLLVHIKAAFNIFGLETCTLQGTAQSRAKQLRKFRQKGQEGQILLLACDQSCSGLDLSCASRVFFAHALYGSSLEVQALYAQAISRVLRYGQERKVEFHHFLARGTVEEGVWEAARPYVERKAPSADAASAYTAVGGREGEENGKKK